MDRREFLARQLGAALLAGDWTAEALLARTEQVLGPSTQMSQRRLVRYLLKGAATSYPPAPDRLATVLLTSNWFDRASGPLFRNPALVRAVLEPAKFAPSLRFVGLDVPPIATPGDLAHWFEIAIRHLDWFADSRRQAHATDIPILQNYAYAFLPKKNGPPRLIEQPKPALKAVQKRILREILDQVPQHDCAHGFISGRSCISSAEIHTGEALVVTVDLKDFFLTTPLRRVHGLFRSLGYPWAVARLLTGLCSTATPLSVFQRLPPVRRHAWQTRKLYQSPHLPQGAPTSPALANLAAWRLDARLSGLARSFDVHYTRYADDLAFSGDKKFAHRVNGFLAAVESIAVAEGYALNTRKTRIMPRAACQRITGLVVNDHLNVSRAAYDALRAILHNCAKNGPVLENRSAHPNFQAHLEGRVGWVENVNPARGQRLRNLFDRVRW